MIVKGTTSGSIRSEVLEIAGVLSSFSLFNNDGGSVSVQVGIRKDGVSELNLFNFSLGNSSSDPKSVYQETNLPIEVGAQVFIVASASINYYLNIDAL